MVPGIAPGCDKLFNIGLTGALTHGRNGQLDAFGHGFVVVGLADIYIIAQSTAVSGRKRDRGVACLCRHGQVRFCIDCRSHGRGQRCRFRPRCACHGHSLPRDIQIDGRTQRGRTCHGYGARGFGQLFSIFHADHAEARVTVVFKKGAGHEMCLRAAAGKARRFNERPHGLTKRRTRMRRQCAHNIGAHSSLPSNMDAMSHQTTPATRQPKKDAITISKKVFIGYLLPHGALRAPYDRQASGSSPALFLPASIRTASPCATHTRKHLQVHLLCP